MPFALYLTVSFLLGILAGCAGEPSPSKPAVAAAPEAVSDVRPVPSAPAPVARDVSHFAASLPVSKKPVMRDGGPLVILRGQDGKTDAAAMLAVETQDINETSFGYVSDFNRLFDVSAKELPFSVELFTFEEDGGLISKSISLGSHRVCGSFSRLPFDESPAFPFGISAIFPDTEGKRNVWILFPGGAEPGEKSPKHSLFSFYEQANVRAYIHDIDENGVFDLLLFEDIIEESSGYETYITWYKWDGKSFNKYRSTNILRKLRAFFDSSRQMLLARSWRRFFTYALLPEDSGKLLPENPTHAFQRIFLLQESAAFEQEAQSLYESLFSREISQAAITDIVFPNIMENPFPLNPDGTESFRFTIRITANEENYFFSARLAMNRNPFSGRMFHFIP
ncbi:MAG: hypothetical protein LBK44_04855 [Spirochaetales bacterium]|nr:hypothetical protein [Spirochaetales bacterium]